MPILKVLASLAVIAVAALLIWFVSIEPVDCSRLELPLVEATNRAMERNDAPLARDTLERASRALRRCPSNIQLRMIAAANLRQLGRPADAIAMYEQALRFDRRPEIYINIGQSRVESGMRARAVDDFVRAVVFAPGMIEEVSPDLRDEVYARAAATGRQATLRNPRFDEPSLRGGGEVSGAGGLGPSAAAEWMISGGMGGSVSTALVPSTRRTGGKMLRVTTNGENTGIVQSWAPPGTGPARVETEAWIFLRRGMVQIATGNSSGITPDAYLTKTGSWQRVAARNGSCPANYTVILAASRGGAEFDVDEVRITPTGGPCGG
ncbi:MAG TPA: tetratricopeptide repeat protein [Thermoanaerobaculia bacterium]|jgi:tetratricopeptide (TPR) repeat protein|nr:tetratricopeptide repeat protein [Thermoanaerobaculia bacterium]